MEIITKRERIAGSIPNFIGQYIGSNFNRTKEINLLRQLDPDTCAAEDVDEIIGDNSWTALNCDECNQPTDVVVHMGSNPHSDYDSGAAVCLSCLKVAVQKLETL